MTAQTKPTPAPGDELLAVEAAIDVLLLHLPGVTRETARPALDAALRTVMQDRFALAQFLRAAARFRTSNESAGEMVRLAALVVRDS